jgi:3-deoxy-D-manno-octulosonic-acid transferase
MPDTDQKLIDFPHISDYRRLRLSYNLLFTFLATIALPVMIPVCILSEKRRKTVFHRMGLTRISNTLRSHSPGKKPVWVQALSVGEVLSCISLVKHLRATLSDRTLVFSVSTATGYDTAKSHIEKYVDAIFYFPYDFSFTVRKRIREIDPAVFVLIESDLWPNVMFECHSRKIPSIWSNARLSTRSFKRYYRFRKFFRPVFETFSMICLQSRLEKERFMALGVHPDSIVETGNLKFDQKINHTSENALRPYQKLLPKRKDITVIIAGSTHPGEEASILWAFKQLRKTTPNIVLIIAPRDHRRSASLARMCSIQAWRTTRFSEPCHTDWDILIIDVVGILRDLYGISDIAFIGGSLEPHGGHNPLEAAARAIPILFGPHMTDFMDIAQMLIFADAAFEVKTKVELLEHVGKLIEDPDTARQMGKKAYRVFSSNKGAVLKTAHCIERFT